MLAMHLMGTSSQDEIPKNYTGKGVTFFSQRIAEQIVARIWMPYENITSVLDEKAKVDHIHGGGEELYDYCICREGGFFGTPKFCINFQ